MKAFLDTSGFYALVSSTDKFHVNARDAYESLILDDVPLYTSSYVLVESIALIQRRLGYSVLKAFVESVTEVFSIIWVGEKIHRDAWALVEQRQGREFSFVDATTILIAKDIDAHVVTFDDSFKKVGIKTLP